MIDWKQIWTNEYLRQVMNQFQEAYENKQYTERIPYDNWRKLAKANKVQVEIQGDCLSVYEICSSESKLLFTDVTYNFGFARFLCDSFVIEDENITKYDTNAAIGTGLANSACSVGNLNTIDGLSYSTSTADAVKIDSKYLYTHKDPSWWEKLTINVPEVNFDKIKEIQKSLEELTLKIDTKQDKIVNENKENEKMKGFNFDFGPCGSTVRMSAYGLAIENINGEWVSYNADTGEIVNVDILNILDGGKYLYRLPVSIKDVQVGDIIIHNRVPMFVTGVIDGGNQFEVTDVRAGEYKVIIPTKNMFNFAFVTKIVNLFGDMLGSASAEAPFGNMLPFLLMSGENGKDVDPLVMMMLMNGQNAGASNIFANPMMLYFMTKSNKDFDPMMLMLMSGNFNK